LRRLLACAARAERAFGSPGGGRVSGVEPRRGFRPLSRMTPESLNHRAVSGARPEWRIQRPPRGPAQRPCVVPPRRKRATLLERGALNARVLVRDGRRAKDGTCCFLFAAAKVTNGSASGTDRDITWIAMAVLNAWGAVPARDCALGLAAAEIIAGGVIRHDESKTEIKACTVRFSGPLAIPPSAAKNASVAFDGCSDLSGALSFPATVAHVGGDAVAGCIGVALIRFDGTDVTIDGLPLLPERFVGLLHGKKDHDRASGVLLLQCRRSAIVPRGWHYEGFIVQRSIECVSFSAGIVGIGPSAFCGCTEVVTVPFASGIVAIGE